MIYELLDEVFGGFRIGMLIDDAVEKLGRGEGKYSVIGLFTFLFGSDSCLC